MNYREFVDCMGRAKKNAWKDVPFVRRLGGSRDYEVWRQGEWITVEKSSEWKELELCVRDAMTKSCKDVVFDVFHDFSNCQEVVVPDVEDLL